jgi:hypothetical protein|nr:MAG TPA: deoxyribosyltransferase [Caudoviricetes sp.]
MLVYVAHPYGGCKENKKLVEDKIKRLVKKHPRHTFISPIHTFGFMYDWVDTYDQGMQMCLKLLKKCDAIILCEGWNASKGCNREFEFARKNNIRTLSYKEVLENWKF